MNTIRKEIQKAIDSIEIRPGMEGVGYEGGLIDGLDIAMGIVDDKWDEAVNDILFQYMKWASNLPASQFDKWDKEEGGDYEKAQERIRREFVKFTNNVE